MTRDRVSGLRDALGAPAALDEDYYDRSFKQQMEDLGVEVVKPELEWYKPATVRRTSGLKDRISINKCGITFGKDAIAKIEKAEDGKVFISIGIIKTKKRNVMAIKPGKGKGGFTVTKTSKQSHRIGTKKLVKWLAERGIEQGVYELRAVEGGFVAVPEGGGGR